MKTALTYGLLTLLMCVTVSCKNIFTERWWDDSADNNADAPVTSVLMDVTANGDGTTPSTMLTLTFSSAVTGLTAGNVMIGAITVSGTPAVSGSGTNWTVGISIASVTPEEGTLITISTPYGSRGVTVYNYTTPPVTPILTNVCDEWEWDNTNHRDDADF